MSEDTASGPPRDHEEHDLLAVGWALHALEPEDESAFSAHLSGCARCTRTVAETHDVMAAMATDLPMAEPSESLRARIQDAVAETEQVRRPAREVPDPVGAPLADHLAEQRVLGNGNGNGNGTGSRAVRSRGRRRAAGPAWRRVLPNALVAAGVAAVLALGTWNVVLAGQRDDVRQTVAQQADVMDALLTPGQATIAPLAAPDGHTVATVVAREGQVHVVADGMAPNDADHSYVLWGMTDDAPVALGTFDVESDRLDLRTVGSATTGLDDYTKYGISLEPGQQAPPAPTDIVATGAVSS